MALSESSAQNYALSDPDVRLMLQVRDGSADAFEELMLRYQGRLVTVLEHLLGKREQAEDLAQETFLRVYRSRLSYRPDSKFSTWLFAIANNLALNARRSQSRRREVNLGPTESGPLGPTLGPDRPSGERANARQAIGQGGDARRGAVGDRHAQ